MDEESSKESPPPDFNKIDLSQLQGFSFGTQWTQDKTATQDPREGGPRRDNRSGDRPAERRDRRTFRRPDGAPGEPAPFQRDDGPDRRPPRDGRDARGGPGGYRERPSHGPERGPPRDRAPYESPHFAVAFYPEDVSFGALIKTIRTSCRTVELFEIARSVLGKPERFTVLVTKRPPGGPSAAGPASAASPRQDATAAAPGATSPPLAISAPDGLPFETEEAAIDHVLKSHMGLFFEVSEAEVDPPKGNYLVVNRCGVTGELLAPPNYHRYAQIVQQHYNAKASRMPFEAFRSRIETVRDPEAVSRWLEKMKKITRYTWKQAPPPSSNPAEGAPAGGEGAPAGGEEPQRAPEPAASFDAIEEARAYLLAHARDRVVRPAPAARFHGRELETLPGGEIHRAIEGALERQRRFPLDTANALRGRLRREHFTIFKKGAKGISYVCAVKRKFRVPGQTFGESIGSLVGFIEANPMIKAGELPNRFLEVPEGPLPPEKIEKAARTQSDLIWLVREGYVTEFIDGRLYAPPPATEGRKDDGEREENDPENFPEEPAVAAAPVAEAPVAEAAPVESAPPPAAGLGEAGYNSIQPV